MLRVLVGTQTGSALEVGQRVVRDARRRRVAVALHTLDTYDKALLPDEKLVLFVCSTTGQGEVPDNMKDFWRFLLRRDLAADSLSSVRVAICGLGDSAYLKFNATAKRLQARLQQLGAKLIVRRADCDDQHPLGVDGELNSWLQEFWSQASTLLPVTCEDPVIPDSERLPSPWEVEILEESSACDSVVDIFQYREYPAQWCTLTRNQRMTPEDHWQDVRHFTLNLGPDHAKDVPPKEVLPKHNAGDVLVVHVPNPREEVDLILRRLQLSPDAAVCIRGTDSSVESWFDGRPVRLLDLFTWHLDVTSTPKRYFFELCSHFSEDELHRDRLQHLSSPDGLEDFQRYCARERRTFREVLEDFPSVSLPLEVFLEGCPVLQPRLFSLASCQEYEADVCVAVVDYTTVHKRRKRGLCSSWLASIVPSPPGQPCNAPPQDCELCLPRIPVWIRPGTFHFPAPLLHGPPEQAPPVVLVGPGTGCAPFRSLLQQKERAGVLHTQCHLYFGCRNHDKDFLFQEDWERWLDLGVLSHLRTAFSRDGPRKVYVQDLMWEDRALLGEVLTTPSAMLFVAGSASKMPQQVLEMVERILGELWGGDLSRAQAHIRSMERQGRLQMETWS